MLIENNRDLENAKDRKPKILILGDNSYFDNLDTSSQNFLIKNAYIDFVFINDITPKLASKFLKFDQNSWYENNLLAFNPYFEVYIPIDDWSEKITQSKIDVVSNILILLGAKEIRIISINKDITNFKQSQKSEDSLETGTQFTFGTDKSFEINTLSEYKKNTSKNFNNHNFLFQEDSFELKIREKQYDPRKAQQLIQKYNLITDIPYLNSISSIKKLESFKLEISIKKELSIINDLTLNIASKLGMNLKLQNPNLSFSDSISLLQKKIINYNLNSAKFSQKLFKIEARF